MKVKIQIKWESGSKQVKTFKDKKEASAFLDKKEECIESCVLNYNDTQFSYVKRKDPCDYTDYEMDMYL